MTAVQYELAIIIPVYNEGENIAKHFSIINEVLINDNIHPAFMLVDDGSTDNTWHYLEQLQSSYDKVTILRFSRNFGKELAICAGLDNISAKKYIIMDSDLQHPPRYIKEMLKLMETTGADIVEGVKESRGKESLKYKLIAKGFYRLLKATTGLELDNSSDFKLIDSRVVEVVREFNERSLLFRGIVDWVGFHKEQLPFTVEDRADGTTKFSTRRLIQLAFNAIISHTSKPLYLTLAGGAFFFLLAVVLGIQTLYNYFNKTAVSGFSTVILLILLTGSMILISLGIIGVYLSRIFDEIKRRPRYIVAGIKTPETVKRLKNESTFKE